jgi:hypothetical protein
VSLNKNHPIMYAKPAKQKGIGWIVYHGVEYPQTRIELLHNTTQFYTNCTRQPEG